VLQSLGIYGVTPDIAEARNWYEKAKEYGSAEALRRIEMLARRSQ
jgi:TPR repeat protein